MSFHRRARSHARILIILHQERSSAGRVGQILCQMGFDLDIRRPPLGDSLPLTLADHAGAVIFGGPMSANDVDEFIQRETDWIDIPLRENKPFLGICLGAQMLCRKLGGEVASRDDGQVEIGWYPILPTKLGKSLLTWPNMVYHFHNEGFSLPAGAELLAKGELFENQAFRYGENAWAIQFHGELTRIMMQRWMVLGAEKFTQPGAQKGREHLHGRMLWDHSLRQWLHDFLALIFTRHGDQGSQPALSLGLKRPASGLLV